MGFGGLVLQCLSWMVGLGERNIEIDKKRELPIISRAASCKCELGVSRSLRPVSDATTATMVAAENVCKTPIYLPALRNDHNKGYRGRLEHVAFDRVACAE